MKLKAQKVLALAVLVILIIIPGVLIGEKKYNDKPGEGIRTIRVLMTDGQIKTLELEEYLVGVVGAEMPAIFGLEAIKAQAVAARTYAMQKLVASNPDEREYDVDTTEKTQAWNSEQELRKKWGALGYYSYIRKISSAVKATKGEVLVYNGSYIQAFYFSSAGRLPTEKSEEVWGSVLPYLTNVVAEKSELEKFVTRSVFRPSELDAKLGTNLQKKKNLNPADVRILDKTSAGRVKTVIIGSKIIPATRLRSALGLKSTDFTLEIEKNMVVLTAYGNGHAVGMSQYGAKALAAKGWKYRQILSHYFIGSELLNIDNPLD